VEKGYVALTATHNSGVSELAQLPWSAAVVCRDHFGRDSALDAMAYAPSTKQLFVARYSVLLEADTTALNANSARFIAGRIHEGGDTDGVGADARLYTVTAMCMDSDEGYALIADSYGRLIRRVDTRSGTVTTLAGDAQAKWNENDAFKPSGSGWALKKALPVFKEAGNARRVALKIEGLALDPESLAAGDEPCAVLMSCGAAGLCDSIARRTRSVPSTSRATPSRSARCVRCRAGR
jgi:hypothetical protein